MWSNVLAAALRNLIRNGTYSAINIFGLAIGFAAAFLIALYVRDEYSYDGFWPDHARIFRMSESARLNEGSPMRADVTFSFIGGALKTDFPEVEETTRLATAQFILRQGDKEAPAKFGFWVDPTFFTFFPVIAVAGDPTTALTRPDGMVMTRAMARRMFGRDNVVGEKLELNRQYPVEITAVIEDLPPNTHLRGDLFGSSLASYSSIARNDVVARDPNALQSENSVTYGRLRPGATLANINKDMRRFADEHIPGVFNGIRFASLYSLYAVMLDDVHFQDRGIGPTKPSGDKAVVQALIAIAALILIVAGSNFVNMMTARSTRRAVEVGIRKTMGGMRNQLLRQFFAEAVIYVLIAGAIAFAAVTALLPTLEGFLQRELLLHLSPKFVLGMFAVVIGIGVLAGAYPALVLSTFRPITVLKGTLFAPTGSGRLRRGLVVFQFAVLIALILATATIYRQIDYAINQRLVSDGGQVQISGLAGIRCSDEFIRELKRTPAIREAACVSETAIGFGRFSAIPIKEDGSLDSGFRAGPTDSGFFGIFGVAPVAGRLFSADYGADEVLRTSPDATGNPNVILNASGARRMGYTNPADAVGKTLRWQRIAFVNGQPQMLAAEGSEIIGVVPDFSIGSVRDIIEPTMYYVDPAVARFLVAKIDGRHIPEALEALKSAYVAFNANRPFEGFFYDSYVNTLYIDIVRQSQLFAIFAGVAIAIACLGLLGLAVFTAERATKEIGLRKAMGANRADILRFLGWQFVRPVLWANLIAWPLAYLFMRRWLEGFAYHVDIEPAHFVLAALVAVVIAVVTVSGHSLIVARARPVTALRYE